MKSKQEITQRIIELAGEQVGRSPADITPEHDFYADLEFDSLDITEFAMNIEDEFVVTVPDESIEKVKKINDAIDLVWDQVQHRKDEAA